MAVRLLVKNMLNEWRTGDVVTINSADHVFGKYESKEKFTESGFSSDDWPSHFVIVNVYDAEPSQLDYLLEESIEGRRYFLSPQLSDSPYYNHLLDKAEITITKSILLTLINDRDN